MGLREQLEEDQKKLAELQAEEAKDDLPEEKPEEKPEDKPEAKPEVETKPEEKPDEKTEPEKSPAQIRVEKKKKEQLLAEELASARARIAELERPAPKEIKDTDPEPNKAEDPTAWLEWDNRQLRQKVSKLEQTTETIVRKEQVETTKQSALNEIQGYEAQVRTKYPDYDAAKSHYATILATGVKLLNPNITNQQLNQIVEFKMLERAAQYQREGYENPVEAMYEESKTWGFKPAAAKEVEEKEVKPDLKKVANNRAKNAGTAAAAGAGGNGEITLTHLAKGMTVAEIARLPKGQVDKILQQAQQRE